MSNTRLSSYTLDFTKDEKAAQVYNYIVANMFTNTNLDRAIREINFYHECLQASFKILCENYRVRANLKLSEIKDKFYL